MPSAAPVSSPLPIDAPRTEFCRGIRVCLSVLVNIILFMLILGVQGAKKHEYAENAADGPGWISQVVLSLLPSACGATHCPHC